MVCLLLVPIYGIYRVVFNLFFHQLAAFPGPKVAAITNLYYAKLWTGGNFARDLEKLHKQYGDIVRIAPNELSFASVSSIKSIYGHASKNHRSFLKTSWYSSQGEGLAPGSLVIEVDPKIHQEARRSLSHAFSAKALGDQSNVLQYYTDLFVEQLTNLGNVEEGISLDEWFNWLTFDIVGDLAFGESFDAVTEAKPNFFISTILTGAYGGTLAELFLRVPILKLFVRFLLPNLNELLETRERFKALAMAKVRGRMQRKNDREDFFSKVLVNPNNTVTEGYLLAQAITLMIAGSETTATFLAGCSFYLLKHPMEFQHLKNEIRAAFSDSSQMNTNALSKLPYLHAVCEESLRLFGPAPFIWPRYSPGAEIDGHFIPAGVVVSTSNYTVCRDSRAWFDPNSFRPERWLPTSHPLYNPIYANDNKESFFPFGIGPRGCLGVNLAYMEMKHILTKMIWTFDMELIAKDIDWDRDTKQFHLWIKPALMTRFVKRSDI
ncbi:cytochrome P450 monooxygenase-like protein [Bisporella sp. PMI_857]|nr:cytochrome P450 monooxygenase-like protein [Bisporella sp. PMI_857]